MDLEEKLDSIFREACELEGGEIDDNFQPGNPVAWDSLANLRLIHALETEFKITFEFDELMEISNWGQLKQVVAEKNTKVL
ncbi:MAG: acyl carrier protein [Treponema sp.]|jgi:acyl carrier protein|nr:acyl carrier protein [Treponema sp.]